mgnify:CR=1 FL=1
MSVWGAIIMSFFGSVFASLTMHWQWGFTGIVLVIPFSVFAVIFLLSVCVLRMSGQRNTLSERTRRAIIWSSMAEGVGLFIASTIIANLHRPEWQLPVMALIVGLHFLPIAFAASYRPFYLLAGALIMAAIIGVVTAAPTGGEIAGIMAATSLWIAALLGVARDWKSKKASAFARTG